MTNRKSNDITSMPYAKWLEGTLRELTNLPTRSICVAAITNDGDQYIDYYNASIPDMLVFSGLINQDAMMNALEANGVIEYTDDEEDIDVDDKEKE